MKSSKYTVIRIITCILFLVPAITTIFNLIQYCSWGGSITDVLGFQTVLALCGSVLLATSIFSQSSKLFVIGATVKAIAFIPWILDSLGHSYLFVFSISYIAAAASWILVVLSKLKSGKTKIFIIVAVGLHALSSIITQTDLGFDDLLVCVKNILTFAIPVMLSGLALPNVEFTVKSIGTNVASVSSSSNTLNQYEKISKLKELLDMDLITQEEFDAKKKELLNL